MKKLSFCVIFILAMIFFLCGCYDDKEIDETAYIIALGIDKKEDNLFSYTFQFSAPLATMSSEGSTGGAESEGGENPTVRNIVISAPDFYTAKNMTNNFLSKTVDMSHLKLIVFSKEVDQDSFLKHSQFLLKEREVRPHTSVALAKDSAEGYLKSVNPELEANTAKYYELLSLRSNNVYSPSKQLSDFVDELMSKEGVSILPVACTDAKLHTETNTPLNSYWTSADASEIKSDRSEMRGMAIFKDGEVKYLTNGDDALVYNILSRDIKNCTLSFKNPYKANEHISFRVSIPKAAKYAVDNSKKPCRIYVSQGFDIEFFGGFLPEGFSSYDELFAYVDWVITQKFSDYFHDLSRGKQADIMKIGDCFKKQFLTRADWENANWEDLFKSAEFKVDVYFV